MLLKVSLAKGSSQFNAPQPNQRESTWGAWESVLESLLNQENVNKRGPPFIGIYRENV